MNTATKSNQEQIAKAKEAYNNWLSESLKELKTAPLPSNEKSHQLLTLALREQNGATLPAEVLNAFPMQVCLTRAEAMGMKLSHFAVMLVAIVMADGRPGSIVMLLHIIRSQYNRSDVVTTVSDLCTKVFPDCFLSEDQLHKLWDMQKVNPREYGGLGDNLLDMF